MKIKIFSHPGADGVGTDDPVEGMLRKIAEHHGRFGEWAEKYGTTVNTKVFEMHPYCWCESETCKWCGEEAPNFHYKPSDLKVWWYKYIGRGMKLNRIPSPEECDDILKNCLDGKLPSTGEAK